METPDIFDICLDESRASETKVFRILTSVSSISIPQSPPLNIHPDTYGLYSTIVMNSTANIYISLEISLSIIALKIEEKNQHDER
jgi:penicillin V acylase-like amidase (Ntn superfamily)